MTKEIIDAEEWLKERVNQELLFSEPAAKVSTYIADLNYTNCIRVASNLNSLSVWLSNVFISKIENTALTVINACNFLEYRFFYSKILITAIDTPGAGARVWMDDLQKLFFLLLAFNRHEQALWLGGRTYLGDTPERFSGRKDEVWTLREVSEWESLGGDEVGWRSIITKLRRLIPGQNEKECSAGKLPDDPMFPYWRDEPLCGYMLRLWLVMSGQLRPEEVPAGHPQRGVYEGLFQHWNDPVKLEESLIAALDYHVCRSVEDDDEIPEFTLRPYNVIPFEILAYRSVRKRMGLETPWPSHPLLDSPFVTNLPDKLPPSDDPLLKEVLAAVRKVLPDV